MAAQQVFQDIVVDPQFCGPPGSANGGYIAGRLAAGLEGSVEVTLRQPPPLGEAMQVRQADDGSIALTWNGALMAEARASVVDVAFDPVPTIEEAESASRRTFPASLHRIPGCFVCGPGRNPDDGLRLHPGPLDPADTHWTGTLATSWTPAASLADENGRLVRPEFVWAALDCPTAYACSSPDGMPLILLGRQTVEIYARPTVAEPVIVLSARSGAEGRKYFATAALYRPDGQRLAGCRATWIAVQPSQLRQG